MVQSLSVLLLYWLLHTLIYGASVTFCDLGLILCFTFPPIKWVYFRVIAECPWNKSEIMFRSGKYSVLENILTSSHRAQLNTAWVDTRSRPTLKRLFQLGGLVERTEQQGLKLFIPQSSNQINTNDCALPTHGTIVGQESWCCVGVKNSTGPGEAFALLLIKVYSPSAPENVW